MKSWDHSCFIDSIFTLSFHAEICCKLSFTPAFQTHRKCLLKRKNRAQGQKPVSIIMRRCSVLPNPFCLQESVFSSKLKFWRASACACAHINADDKGSAPNPVISPHLQLKHTGFTGRVCCSSYLPGKWPRFRTHWPRNGRNKISQWVSGSESDRSQCSSGMGDALCLQVQP